MGILDQLGRQAIQLGSSPACELYIDAPEISPRHAEIIHVGQGQLLFLPGGEGACFLEQRKLEPNVPVPFDFQSRFFLEGHELPLTSPVICQMLLRRGALPPRQGELVLGRDPERCHLILASPGVSGRHATLHFPEPSVVDHHSTSGTWYEGKRIEADVVVPLEPQGLVAIGPVPLPLSLAREIYEALHVHKSITSRRAAPRDTSPEMPVLEAPPPPFLPLPAPTTTRHRTVMGTVRMALAREFSIGRTQENDIVLDHPQVASHHAKLLSIGSTLFLQDGGSELGTYVRGARVSSGQRVPVEDGERVLFGPLPAILHVKGDAVELLLEDRADWAGRPLFEIEAQGLCVEVRDRDDPSRTKRLLESVSFHALPGDLIALMGPSGSGKTTLLHVLTGYRTPQRGEVRINGHALETIFDALRGSIGYVPQDDIIHPELTVWEAVRYSARFRLPSDYSDAEIDQRVRSTLSELGLDGIAHLQIGKPEAKILSGGQRKRVNIALELVTDPVLLFLDEPTSGLAADDTAALVELLAHLAQSSGKTIIATIHQPAKYEYEKFNLALILGQGGVPLYFGPTRGAYSFFESWRPQSERSDIDNPRDMFAELAERETRLSRLHPELSRSEAKHKVAEAFRKDYESSGAAEEMQSGARAFGAHSDPNHLVAARHRPKKQLSLLLSRYLKVKLRDHVGTAILLLQAPIIGILLALVFGGQKESVPYWCLGALEELARRQNTIASGVEGVLSRMHPTLDQSAALFFLVVAAVWFGTSNAAREIVSERAIYQRERMVNLGVPEYVLSKFVVLSALSALQCTILLGIVFFALNLSGGLVGFGISLGMLVLTSLCSVALGLLLSAVVVSSEAAMALTPIALIPQVVLGGLMVPVTTVAWLELPMLLIPARWGFEGVVRVERLAQSDSPAWRIPLDGVTESAPDFIRDGAFHCAEAQLKSTELLGAWGFQTVDTPAWAAITLGLMTLVCLSIVMARLFSRDPTRR